MLVTTTLGGIEYNEYLILTRTPEKTSRLIALLFCRPDHPLMKSDIIPSLPYFHFRSGGNTAFYFGGFEYDEDEWAGDLKETKELSLDESTYTMIRGPEGQTWCFIPRLFNLFRREVQNATNWRYSGGCDMILANSRIDKESDSFPCTIDFRSSMVLRLDRLSEIPSMPAVSVLFETIFRYAEDQDPVNPVWGFSNAAGITELKQGLWSTILSLLPEGIRKSANASQHLIVHNLAAAT